MSGSRLPVSGSDRTVLEALSEKLKEQLNDEKTPPYSVPQLSRELRATLADLRALPVAKKATKLDELATRRKNRVAGADAPAATGG